MEKSKHWLPDPKTWKGTWRDDWRIRGQEGYLKDKYLKHIKFNCELCFEDFDQCDFCYDIFDEGASEMAYYDPDTRHWVCEKCYKEFKSYFNWTSDDE